MSVIEFNSVCEKYRIKFITDGKVSWEEIWALRDISFKVANGEILGVIGENGAGKTTLLELIAGMLMPDSGTVNVYGKVSTLMELGAGFNSEFTGRENIVLNAKLYGFTEDALEQQMEKIVEFAGLGKFINAPIKYYSQGMYMRLAFALAIFVEPDILLIDDILAVGDEEAQQKCIKKIFELKESGKTIILVSHNMDMVSKLCNRIILLEKGRIIKEGLPQKVIPYYLEIVGDKKGIAILEKDKLRMVFNNGKILLSYAETMLTKGMGGYISFFLPSANSWLSSFKLSWQIKDILPNKIIAEGRYGNGALSQIWTLTLQEDYLQWQVEVKNDGIKEPHIDLFFDSQYKKWLTLEKEEDFSAFLHRYNWQHLGFNNCNTDLIGLCSDKEVRELPNIILKTEEKDNWFNLHNTGYEQEARVIQLYFNRKSLVNISLFSEIDKFQEYIKNVKHQSCLKQQAEAEKLRLKQQQEEARLLAQRTLSSGNLKLFADLEHKALRLYFKDKELTKGSGLDSSFLINKHWYDSSLSEWQIDKDNTSLMLTFFWKNLGLTQVWNLSFKDQTLLWQVESSSKTRLNLEVLKFGLSLIPQYQTFFCGHQQAKFPEEFSIWQDIPLEAPQAELFGLKKENKLPGLALKNKVNLNCIVQNSDLASSCRILQLGLTKEMIKDKNSFTTELNLLEDEAMIEDYIKEKKTQSCLKQQAEAEKLRLKQQQEEARLLAQRTLSSGNLKLFADLEHKALRLYFKDKELTKGSGLNSSFYISQRWFNLNDAKWNIKKISENELMIILNYESLMLSQIWTLICKEKDTLKIRIEIETNKNILLTNQDVKLELTDKYQNWITRYEQGKFLVNQYINNIGPIRLKDGRISQVALKSDVKGQIPILLFKVSSQVDKRILGIYKYKESNEEYICVNSSLVIPKKEELVSPGRYTYFEGEIVLNKKEIKLKDEPASAKIISFSKDKLRFVFERGKGRIFWGQKELTTGLGVYTSLRSSGIWYDSSQAVWQVINKSDNEITVFGNWPYIPVSQIWQIEFINKHSILWKVDMKIYGEVNLEIEQANLMLSSEYKTWKIPGVSEGEFINEYTQDYDILPFRFWYGKSERIGVIGDKLPSISFKCNSVDKLFRAIVENTDYLYKARLLQYQKSNVAKLPPKKYTYFEGVIKVRLKD